MNNAFIEKLKKKALSLYPYQISDSDPAYSTSSEFQYLMKTKEDSIGRMMPHWRDFINDLKKVNPKYNLLIEDWKASLSRDHCFKAVIIATKSATKLEDCLRLVINISTLIPFYVVHQAVVTPDSRVINGNKYNAVSFKVSSKHNKIYEILIDMLAVNFIGYQAVGPEVILSEINEIEHEGVGHISPHLDQSRPMNLFNAFFSNHYL